MAYGISHFFPGGTKAQVEAVMLAMNGTLGVIPKGQLFHAAGTTPGGWQIVAVHDGKDSWRSFLSEVFMPALRKGIPGGFTAPPTELEFDVTHLYR